MACTEVKGTKAIRLFDSTGEEPQRVLPDPGASMTDLTTALLRVETATLGQGASVRAEPDLIDFRDEERSPIDRRIVKRSEQCV